MASKWDSERKENEVPLLEDEMLYPNCPGCKCAHLSAKGAGPPVKQLLMVSSVVVCNALPISSLLAFLYFMVRLLEGYALEIVVEDWVALKQFWDRIPYGKHKTVFVTIDDFHVAKRTEDIGYYAGAIVSVFMVGRVLSSVAWGMFADKYGRRSVFFLGLLSIIVLQPVFGASKNYWIAFVARFLLGTFNGMLGPLKAYSSEICSSESRAWGLNVASTSWSLGLIVGPALGGFLARPVINFPGIFSEDSIFASYPYLLPSLFQAGFAIFELGVVYCLPETIHKHGEESPSDIVQKLVESEKTEKPSLWLNWPLMASVAVYCVWSLHEISFSEIFSMWCVSPKETGGLVLRTSDVGTILSISGFGMLCLQLSLFPPLAKWLGPIMVTRTPAFLAIPLVALFPFMPYLHGQMQWLSLNFLALLRNSLSAMVVTGSFLLVNNAVPPDQLGAANGISLSCVSVFRAIGPAAGGAIFAWGQSRRNAAFLPGSQLVFAILDLICVAALFTMFPPFLPKHLNESYSEQSHHVNSKKDVPILQ